MVDQTSNRRFPDGFHWGVATSAHQGVALGIVGGRLLGDNVLLLAMAAAGSFMILSGTQVLFESRLQADTTDPATGLYQRLALFLFAVFFAVSALPQVNERRLQRALRW
jgi:hypothetical protein